MSSTLERSYTLEANRCIVQYYFVLFFCTSRTSISLLAVVTVCCLAVPV